MKKTAKLLFLSVLIYFVTSCIAPGSKESYLTNFERFVKDVEKNADKFTAQDWRWSNKRFSRYTGDWYNQFGSELNMEEKIQVSVLKTRYLSVKGSSTIGRYLNENLKQDLEKAGENIKKYIDKNLDEDIREISEGAREIGDSAVKVMKDVLKEIKREKK